MEFDDLKRQSNLKVLLEGESGTGKTINAAKIALGVLDNGGSVLYADTEAEGSETIVNVIESTDYEESVVANLDYERVGNYDEMVSIFEKSDQYDLLVIDTLDHKHTFVLKAVTDAKRDGDADWNEYATIYSEEKEFMGEIGNPETNIVATLDPDSGKDGKPKGAQTNVRGYFSAVVQTKKTGDNDCDHKILNWVGNSDWIGKKLPDLPKVVSEEIAERLE